MTDANTSFLARRQARAASRELTQMLVLGYVLGFLALGVGAYRYFITPDASDALWKAVAWAGAASILATLVAPMLWRGPERVLQRAGNWVGQRIMGAVLLLVYYALFWPVGALMRATQGSHPIYRWDGAALAGMEGWRKKDLPGDIGGTRKGRVGVFSVVTFFVRRGHYFLIPVLLLLVSIGIALFFLQTSALAPFIYTLF